MLAPTPILHDPDCLVADVRRVLSLRPCLADYPERVAALLGIEEHDVLAAYEALEVEGELLP